MIVTTPTAAPTKPVTAEEFVLLWDQYEDLDHGVLTELPMPNLRHGQVCMRIGRLIANFVDDMKLGHVMSNDSHFLIRRDPDTVRGPDVSYYSFERLPPGPAPEGLTAIVPNLAVEVRSPTNTWNKIFVKVGEYLGVGVTAVLVLDPDGMTASIYRNDSGPGQIIYHTGDTLTIPDVLPGFSVSIAKLFE